MGMRSAWIFSRWRISTIGHVVVTSTMVSVSVDGGSIELASIIGGSFEDHLIDIF